MCNFAGDAAGQPEIKDDEGYDEERKVEKVLKRKLGQGRILYLVTWKGYGPAHDAFPFTSRSRNEESKSSTLED
ncbi:hypothetical protein V1509DRAFT_637570 [Lipomyces kononenkoae]